MHRSYIFLSHFLPCLKSLEVLVPRAEGRREAGSQIQEKGALPAPQKIY
jgi:hypothetical protein